MDIKKLTSAIDASHVELNSVIDTAVKTRSVNGLRSLTLAANHLSDAQKAVEKAAKQSEPKAAKPVALAESEATPASGKGKK